MGSSAPSQVSMAVMVRTVTGVCLEDHSRKDRVRPLLHEVTPGTSSSEGDPGSQVGPTTTRALNAFINKQTWIPGTPDRWCVLVQGRTLQSGSGSSRPTRVLHLTFQPGLRPWAYLQGHPSWPPSPLPHPNVGSCTDAPFGRLRELATYSCFSPPLHSPGQRRGSTRGWPPCHH